MNRGTRLLGVVALAATIAMVVYFGGREEVAPSSVPRASVTAVVGQEGGSWYCAARDTGVEGDFRHTVFVTAVGEDAAKVRLDGFNDTENVGDAELTIEPTTTATVDVAESLGSAALSVMVESDRPVVVEHRISFAGGAEQVPCSTFSSDTWYFPVVVTTADATARLNLFNPFPGDASVDIEVAWETGVRQPTSMSGLVVPAGSTRTIDLHEGLERREQASFTVRTRSGGVVPELAQVFDGSNKDLPVKGLRLVPGSRSAGLRWNFPGGFADPGARERLVVQNPNDVEVDVLAQLVPFGGVDLAPEPFELSAASLRFASVDLEADSRVPAQGYHSLDVESEGDKAVIPARSLNITGEGDGGEVAPLRTLVKGGTTASPGLSVAAKRWAAPGMQLGEGSDGAVFVYNPGEQSTRVTVSAWTASGGVEPVVIEVPPGDAGAVGLSALSESDELLTVEVTSEEPVSVERLIVFRDTPDLSLQSGVPVLESLDELVTLGGD
ncbi:MAG: DUF5719 family protein [Microthrixaceae bacterium]